MPDSETEIPCEKSETKSKKHILLAHKTFEAISGVISSDYLTEAEGWQFLKALYDYDKFEKIPDFPNGVLKALWISTKPEQDSYAQHWNEESERRSKAGKKGGSSTSEKKGAAARINGRKGGAPSGNKNAAKTTQADNDYGIGIGIEKDSEIDPDPENQNNNENGKKRFDDIL